MVSGPEREDREYDRVSQASLNGIYVKAQELDRGHNAEAAPHMLPPGAVLDSQSHASTHASDASEFDAVTSASSQSDVETHASTHASER